MAKTRDMTVGSPIKLSFGFFLPLLFGLLFFSLTRRTPSLEDLSVVQQYFDKFLCELAQEA